jgi:hypothetical protein
LTSTAHSSQLTSLTVSELETSLQYLTLQLPHASLSSYSITLLNTKQHTSTTTEIRITAIYTKTTIIFPPFTMPNHTLWTPAQNHLLIHLHETDGLSWSEIALQLCRSPTACSAHYKQLEREAASSLITWTPAHDKAIVTGKRRGLSTAAISIEMSVCSEAITERWSTLQREKKVPEEVLAVWRRREKVEWSVAEDGVLLDMYCLGLGDVEIAKTGALKGRSREEVRMRRVELMYGEDRSLWLKKLGMRGKGKHVEMTALEKALGKPKYDWMSLK